MLFETYAFLRRAGFNVMLYGVGSKMEILSRFKMEYLEEECLEILGFSPTISIRKVSWEYKFNKFSSILLDY